MQVGVLHPQPRVKAQVSSTMKLPDDSESSPSKKARNATTSPSEDCCHDVSRATGERPLQKTQKEPVKTGETRAEEFQAFTAPDDSSTRKQTTAGMKKPSQSESPLKHKAAKHSQEEDPRNTNPVLTHPRDPQSDQSTASTSATAPIQKRSIVLSPFEMEFIKLRLKDLVDKVFHSSATNIEFVKAEDLRVEPGDLIEIDRGVYFHCAMYVSDGYVIHVTGNNEINADFSLNQHALIKKQSLVEVAGTSLCRVNNKTLKATEKGLQVQDLSTVIAELETKIGSRVDYHVLRQNCETYVTTWRYGQGWSDQSESAASHLSPLVASMLLSTPNIGEILVTMIGELCRARQETEPQQATSTKA